jgi:hypothetical protein
MLVPPGINHRYEAARRPDVVVLTFTSFHVQRRRGLEPGAERSEALTNKVLFAAIVDRQRD